MSNQIQQKNRIPSPDGPEILGEVLERRTEYAKEFRRADGSRLMVLYPDPVHYRQGGRWQDIDNRLVEALDDDGAAVFTNRAGAMAVRLPRRFAPGAPITLTHRGYRLRYRMEGDFPARAARTSLRDRQLPHTAQVDSTLYFPDVFPQVDVSYTLHANELKEAIRLKARPDTAPVFTFQVEAPGLAPFLQPDGSLFFRPQGAPEDEPVFVFPAPFLVDARGERSDDVQVEVNGDGEGLTLVYAPCFDWLQQPGRAFPVIMDPVVRPSLSINNIQDQQVDSNKNDVSHTSAYIECGRHTTYGIERIYMRYNELPALTAADVVVAAAVSIKRTYNSTLTTQVNVHKVKGSWSPSTLQWSNRPDYNTRVEDFQLVKDAGWYTWDITDIAREWYAEGKNYGMLFKVPDAIENASSSNNKTFCSSDNYVDDRPVLQIAYRNACGLEGYWDYHSHSVGRAGAGHVNDYTGNLVFTHPVMGFASGLMPVSITAVYNANDKDTDRFGFGCGWRTNYSQRIDAVTLNSTAYLRWEDEDGTRHYFKQDGSVYKDEDGLEMTITAASSGNPKYTLTDKKDNRWLFDTYGRLYRIENNQATRSAVVINYSNNTGNYILNITDGSGGFYQFRYNGALIRQIDYMGTGSSAITTRTFSVTDGNFTASNYPDGKSVSFTYDANHLLTRAQDIDGYAVTYAYTTTAAGCPSRVKKISEFSGSTAGGELTLSYAHNQTTFTDHKGRKTIAQFNNLGNTVSVQDDEGRAGYWQYANDGADESNTTRQNQLTAASKLQDSVVNLLKNGDCERGDGWAFLGDTATGTMSYTSSQKYMGTKALQLSRTNSTGRAYIRQVVNIKPNTTYTLSAYMKASNLSGAETAGGSYGAGIMLECVPVEGQYKNIFSKTYWEDTDWVRLETTYTTPATLYHPYMSCYLTVGFQSGTAYFDCIQLEEAPTASRFNLVQNADFSFPGATANDALYWGKGSACTASEKRVSLSPSAYPKQDGYCFQITGIADNERRVYQDIPISGSTGDVYTLAGWAKGDSVPISGSRKFGLMLRFYETNGDPGDVTYVNFNPDMDGSLHSDTVAYTGWQFACGKIVAKKPYSKIRVMIAYEHNANTAWFDNIQLFKEEFGHSFVYDSQGNVTSATDILKKSSSYEWTDNDLTKMTLPTGASYTYSYDGHHNVTSASSATGVQSSFGYTAKGLNTSVKAGPASKPIESNATYDAFSRVSSITNPARKSINYEYDAQNRIVATKAPNDTDSTKTHTTYNNVGQVTQVSKNVSNLHHSISSPASASFTYENDRIKTMTHPGSIYTYNYGPFGVLASFMVGQHTMITHEYDTAGRTFNLLKSTYGNGDFVQYTYDHFDRITGIRFNGDTSDRFTFKYDNCGALAEVCDIPLDICTRTLYDFAGRPIKLTQTKISDPTYQWHAYRYEYDDYGRLSRFVEDAGNLGDMETAYTFDLDGRITQQTFGSYKHTWEYDSYGRLTTRKNYYNNNLVLTTAFTYFDPDGSHTTSLPASCTQTSSAGYSKSFTFQYDDNGNISEIAEVNGNRIRCAYNELNQLLRVDDAIYTYVSQYYFYDAAGNFVGIDEASVMFTPDMPDHTWGAGSYKYQDSQGWGDLITSIDSINHSHDEIGNLLSDGTWTYTWEGGKRLKSVSKDGTSLEFAYDAQGRRVSKKVNGASTHYDWVGNHITCLWNDSDELFFRYDADGHPVSLTFQGNDYFYLVNAQGDVMGIMDTSGNLVVEYQYDVWGALFLMSGSLAETLGKKNPLRYRGYIYDEETKLYYLVSRYYSPAMKRFISPDSYSVSSASLTSANMFAYCDNNPISRLDPNGNTWDEAWEYHKLRQEYAQMGIPYPGTPGSHVPDKSGRFGTMDDAATNWAINNRHLSYEKERGALIYYNTPTKKYELGETFIGNENTVIGGFIGHYLNILYNPSSMLVGFVHSHPYPWITMPNGELEIGHNDFPSYPQDGSFVSRYIHDIFVLGLIDIQEVYVVPYKVCPGMPLVVKSSDTASWYDWHINNDYPMIPWYR